MFNPFKKKDGSIKVTDKIWMTQAAKWNGIVDQWKKDPNIVIIAWFDSTLRHLETLFAQETSSAVSMYSAREVHSSQLAGKKIIFAEHHPMRKKEQDAFVQWHLTEAIVYSGLDEPLFKLFGSDKIIGMMKSMGMKENEVIEHKMISSSIENAQEKIEKKVVTEQTAASQEEWVERNL
jgi:hypothetical protein